MTRTKKPKTKSSTVTQMISRERGATVAELEKATGWKPHSVRAFLSGVRRTATLVKEERSDGRSAYRIVPAGEVPPQEPEAEVQP